MPATGYTTLAFLGGSMSGGEILIVMIAILLLFGSKNLPSIARNLGKSMEAFRKASRDVTDEIMRADLNADKPPVRPVKSVLPPPAPADDDEEPGIAIKPSAHTVERNESDRT